MAMASPAPRRIVVCIDGTKNEPGGGRTNVQRIYSAIRRIPDRQITYYQPGVGTLEPIGAMSRLRRKVLMVADAADGWMIQRHVCAAYEFLCETCREGDELYLFGFSRGAHAVRILAGMLSSVGLLHPGMHEMVPFAWKAYGCGSPFPDDVHQADAGRPGRNAAKRAFAGQVNTFKQMFCRSIPIRFVGVWDTVGSVGLPWRPTVHPATDDNPSIMTLRQALSLDERRMAFQPIPFSGATSQDVDEVWFPGVHSDVGGGYGGDAAATSRIPLAWMLRELAPTGMVFDDEALKRLTLPSLDDDDALADAASRSRHDELQRWGWRLVEGLPIPRWYHDDRWRFTMAPHACASRRVPAGARVHVAVRLRQQRLTGYAPRNLPPDAVFVR